LGKEVRKTGGLVFSLRGNRIFIATTDGAVTIREAAVMTGGGEVPVTQAIKKGIISLTTSFE
jgi:hypothetical protein